MSAAWMLAWLQWPHNCYWNWVRCLALIALNIAAVDWLYISLESSSATAVCGNELAWYHCCHRHTA